MNWKRFLKDYFTFPRKERIGLVILVVLILLIWVFPKIISPKTSYPISFDTSWIAFSRKLEQKEVNTQIPADSRDENINELTFDKPSGNQPENSKFTFFYFDPNTLSFEGWKKLGMREKTITTIQKYLAKGGHFYKPADLNKIYGIHPDEYEKLEAFIKIEALPPSDVTSSLKTEFKKDLSPKYLLVEINTSDTSAFIALPGIGNKLAARIVNFREKLGGFYSIDQVGETYGLPDSTFQKIRSFLQLENSTIKKININTATKDEMKTHPYLRWTLANAIAEYRNQHGNYVSLNDLKKIAMITDDLFNKIKYYVTL